MIQFNCILPLNCFGFLKEQSRPLFFQRYHLSLTWPVFKGAWFIFKWRSKFEKSIKGSTIIIHFIYPQILGMAFIMCNNFALLFFLMFYAIHNHFLRPTMILESTISPSKLSIMGTTEFVLYIRINHAFSYGRHSKIEKTVSHKSITDISKIKTGIREKFFP